MEPFAVANHRFAAFVADTGYLTEAEREGWWFDAPMGHVGFRVISAAWSNGNSATPA